MVKAIAAEAAIAFYGVHHKDFTPRNVICSGNLRSTDLRVAIIDFNISVVTRIAYSWIPRDYHQLPNSPICRWWDTRPQFEEEWLPGNFNEWLWKHWAGSPLYQPVRYPGEDAEDD